MIPPKSDPKWTKFLNNLGNIVVTELPTRMLLNRIKMKVLFDPSEAVRKQAIDDAFDFFTKNEAILGNDVQKVFG